MIPQSPFAGLGGIGHAFGLGLGPGGYQWQVGPQQQLSMQLLQSPQFIRRHQDNSLLHAHFKKIWEELAWIKIYLKRVGVSVPSYGWADYDWADWREIHESYQP